GRPRMRDDPGSRLRRQAPARLPRPAARGRSRAARDRRADAAPRRHGDWARGRFARARSRAARRADPPPRGAAATRARGTLGRRPVTRDLTSLFEPETLAIVGVSADPGKWGYWFARDAALGAHRRRVYLVGRNGGEVHGLPVHRSLADLPEAPELVILSVPADGLEQAVDDSLAAGARALVAIAAGFAELGEEGAARERALVD